ncbi:MAG TPA: hypothetical protein PLW13_16630, partial [Pseudomonadales bacterium]|nr:hypothetical protein [Pseudomonadales bacterium]
MTQRGDGETEEGFSMSNAVNDGRRIVAGRSIRWDEERANEAYAQGFWVRETLAEALARAA